MDGIPVICFAGWSGSGKTTLLEKLIPALSAAGYRTAAVKHDAHGLSFDGEGKDSRRLYEAGAACSVVSGPGETALFLRGEAGLEQTLTLLPEADLVLVEGYKDCGYTQFGLCRGETGKGFTAPLSRFAALITDTSVPDAPAPVFHPDDIEGIVTFMVKNMDDFTHFNPQGRAKMVNVEDKEITRRTASAGVSVLVSRETFDLIRSGGMKKGDVLTVAQIAGVMGAKRTPELIPMCHPIPLTGVDLDLRLDEAKCSVEITATVSCTGRTGVEMEALTAAATAALTVYDMCKAVQKDMEITDLRLLDKTGGVHGDYHREGAE